MSPADAANELDALVRLMARDMGLDLLAQTYPHDLAVAAQGAAQLRNALYELDAADAEPWPPMRVRSGA